MENLQEITALEHKNLQDKLFAFSMDKITAAELKHTTAPFGIYQQKNGKFMIRIRITGGILSIEDMEAVGKLLTIHKEVGFSHITTRQDIQLHDVPLDHVYPIVNDAVNYGLIFRGGGGNTFRNIAASPESGLSKETIFDIHPHAKVIQQFVFGYNEAYDLPRKLKISLSCSEADTALATVQDLGFIAHIRDGERGFKVYIAGGMGRESSPGLKLFEFLPEKDILKAVAAVIDFFHNHGDRENRNHARLRFLREDLGDEAFVQLYMSYFSKTTAENLKLPELIKATPLKVSPPLEKSSEEFNHWVTRACTQSELYPDIVSVELFIPNGNLNAEQFNELAEFIRKHNCSEIRLKSSQNIMIPYVHKDSLRTLYFFLQNYSPSLLGESFVGMLKSCVGSTTCKIGILDTPFYAGKVAEVLDKHFTDKPQLQAELYQDIINSISFSGCPNSCGAHQIAKLGFQGSRKRIDGEMTDIFTIFRDAIIGADKTTLGQKDNDTVDAKELESFISNWLRSKLI